MAKIRFSLPDGFQVPEGMSEGDDIEVLASLKLEAGGKACLVEIDGLKMPGYKEDNSADDTKESKTYPQAAADRFDSMQGQGGPPQGGAGY